MTVRALTRFDETHARAAAEMLVADICDEVVPMALQVASAHAAAQGETVGNIRTRATGTLSASGVILTLALSAGLLQKPAPVGFPSAIAFVVLGSVVGFITAYIQKPRGWAFDHGTEVLRDCPDVVKAQRAAVVRLERAIAKNEHIIHRMLMAYLASLLILGLAMGLLVLDFGTRR
jgi:hypothetical protein